ncbi:hypothetical protein [Deinococcus sp. QL22]|uniref:hypothetical protein n=1 Tax=Deinococcus sp. QL22 TaxID=2939437 RepID=UPI002017DF94|nr:hypothetical protein [Deinococcus sp. QL22]UQN05402.1 hypothetical protein M1R55_11005 [Deinococcus sp. QL22]
MPAGFKITITLAAEELRRAEAAAQRTALSLEAFCRNAVLNACRDVKLAPPQYKPHQLTHIHKKAASEDKVWTEEELRERGLPLYWSRAWVDDQLARGHSHAEIAINAGGYQVMAVSRHLRLSHGIVGVKQKTPEQQQDIYARISQGATREQIMQEFRLSEFGAGRYFQLVQAENELQLRFRQEIARLEWPATKPEVAQTLFPEEKQRTTNWLAVRVKKGWLVRVEQGVHQPSLEFLGSAQFVSDQK